MAKEEKYIQVGEAALRGPDGNFLPAVPLYIRAGDCDEEAEEELIHDIGHLFALQMKKYMDECKKAGVPL
ncbi:MAG: hypothetical protein IJK35_09415 [Oscillospiraceae bacterium]|nr:hypothetical protein [Oscillospiraceae bacterium]